MPEDILNSRTLMKSKTIEGYTVFTTLHPDTGRILKEEYYFENKRHRLNGVALRDTMHYAQYYILVNIYKGLIVYY